MKYFTVFLAAIFLTASIFYAKTNLPAQNAQKAEVIKKASKMSKADFKRAYQQSHKRAISTEQKQKFNSLNKQIKKSPIKKNSNENLLNQNLPTKMVFPGEFEEIKAVLIAWPYVTFDTTGNFSEQLFDNVGIYYNQSTKQYSLGPMYSSVDTFPQSPFPPIFSEIIHAIDNDTEVWIDVWYPEDTIVVKNYMNALNYPLKHYKFFVNPGNSFWYRDCGPVAFYYNDNDDIAFMDFEYYSGRPLDDSIPINVGKKMGIPVYSTSVGYEGGNILLDGSGNLFTSSMVYNINNTDVGQYFIDSQGNIVEGTKIPLSVSQVNDSLKSLLNLNSVNVYTSLQNDGGTGHIDLYADMTDENYFVFSKYPDEMKFFPDYAIVNNNISQMMELKRSDGSNYRDRLIPFPRKDDGTWYTNGADYETYTRTYSNHLLLNKTIIQPLFANKDAGDYQQMLRDVDSLKLSYPGYKIVTVDVRDFDGSGGAIHCITKQIPADNPIRIFHNPPPEISITQRSYTLTANIYNKSGIKSASVFWRYKGETNWQELPMTDLGNQNFSVQLQNDTTTGSIQYYILANSNNGKTMTKPLTAPDGYYSFAFSNTNVVDNQPSSSELIGDFYPNPAKDESAIKINFPNSCFDVKLTDILGNVISQNSFSAQGEDLFTINSSSLKSGVYFVTFYLPNGNVLRKELNVIK